MKLKDDFQPSQYRKKCGKCRNCIKIKSNLYYIKNKQILNEKSKLYTSKNKEKIDMYQQLYRNNHKKSRELFDKEYRKNNKEKIKEYNKQYRTEKALELSDKNRIYRDNNKEKLSKASHQRKIQRRKHDPNFNLRENISNAVNKAIKRGGMRKNGSIIKFLPYSMEQLKQQTQEQGLRED